jgi:hypothetical protein
MSALSLAWAAAAMIAARITRGGDDDSAGTTPRRPRSNELARDHRKLINALLKEHRLSHFQKPIRACRRDGSLRRGGHGVSTGGIENRRRCNHATHVWPAWIPWNPPPTWPPPTPPRVDAPVASDPINKAATVKTVRLRFIVTISILFGAQPCAARR